MEGPGWILPPLQTRADAMAIEVPDAPCCTGPWGCYTVLADDDRFKVKRLVLKPGARYRFNYTVTGRSIGCWPKERRR